MSSLDERECLICGKSESVGITVCQKLICASCEKKIMGAEAHAPGYDDLVGRLKGVWESLVLEDARQ